MIPQEIIDAATGAYFCYVGSRDEALIPTIVRFWGMDFRASEDIVIVFIVAGQGEQTLKNSQQNGRLTATLTRWPDFQSYQLKGQFLQARAMTEEEVTFQQQYRIQPVQAVTTDFGFPVEPAERYVHYADLAIEIKVETVFNQTPGPGAGKMLALI